MVARGRRARLGGNDELQVYTTDPANAAHDGQGKLVIRALKRGDAITSARLITKVRFAFQYGRVEARALLPVGSGLWSAIWMLGSDMDEVGWPDCGEIDVMENLGADPDRVFGTVHCPGHSGSNSISGDATTRPMPPGTYRPFAVDWEPGSIVWSVDGRAYHSVSFAQLGTSWVFDHPFYLLINLAVGGTLGVALGFLPNSSSTIFASSAAESLVPSLGSAPPETIGVMQAGQRWRSAGRS